MATTPIMQTVGSIAGAGTAGEGRKDIAVAETVDITDTVVGNAGAPHLTRFLSVPPGSALTVLTDDATETPSFVPDVDGSYHIEMLVDGVHRSSIIVSIKLGLVDTRMPAFNERVGDYNEAGQAQGWHPDLIAFMRQTDALLALAGAGPHNTDHEDGGSDEITAQNLGSGGAGAGAIMSADGSGGWNLETDNAVLDVAQTFTAQQKSAIEVLTDAANVSIDSSDSNLYELTATGGVGATRQLDNPTGIVAGQTWVVLFIQDGTGGRALTYDTFYDFGDEGTPDHTTDTANKYSIITCIAKSATKIGATALKGFTA